MNSMKQHRTFVNAFDLQAFAYEEKFMDLDLYNDTYNAFCNLVACTDPEIFEIGCGPGNITRYLQEHIPEARITATDLSPNMVELARKNNKAVQVEVMDCRDIGQIEKRYNAIMCGFCVPYLNREELVRFCADAAALLQTGGILYISTIEGDYSRSGWEASSNPDLGMHVFYYQEQDLRTFLSSAGMEVTCVFRKDYAQPGKAPSVHLVLIAKKNNLLIRR